ncbi:MAG: DUF882 domain-containing protein [Burkholderiaceae bacterium]
MEPFSRRAFLGVAGLGVASLAAPVSAATAPAASLPSDARILTLQNLHTHEVLRVCLERGQKPGRGMCKQFSHFMRDHYNGRVGKMDPDLIVHLLRLTESLEVVGSTIKVISAYRAPSTNAMLREQGKKVAVNSLHLEGRAMDIRMDDVALKDLRDAALDLRAGGVGYYRKSNFLHFDTGRVRHW